MNVQSDAWKIDYTMRSIRYPSMAGYVKGEPIRKVEFYNTTFQLRGRQ
jgi:hypothetical protein